MPLEAFSLKESDHENIQHALDECAVTGDDPWNHEKFKPIRSRAKKYYITGQGYRCCYCDQENRTSNGNSWTLDHIVPRNEKSEFSFLPENWAISCPDCNIHKSDKRVLMNSSVKNYPTKSLRFKIIHPHHDEFADHIVRRNFVYQPKDDKGKFTIYACDLLRFAADHIKWPLSPADKRYEDEVNLILIGDVGAAALKEQILDDLFHRNSGN
ncbi:HNH endonuclease [Arthrobacter sp. AG258]|uniref:HNH endonuclease n=1 Tax=Arthrobacter sp. AG258 TaxID=2183899 RepID=UPI00105D9350|nr:HNH endonuclease [Arthrobacter sp. AG258]TDT78665.1 HNH endonuclease [Arthrobacter sp. AG258]